MESPLGLVLARLQEQRESRHLDVRVDGLSDRLGVDVHVRYAAKVRYGDLKQYVDKRRKKGHTDWDLLANLDMIVDCCIGVYATVEGKSYGLSADESTDPADWPRFDDQLRAMLPDGVGESAVSIARGLFEWPYNSDELGFADREILAHGEAIMQFYATQDGDDPSGG